MTFPTLLCLNTSFLRCSTSHHHLLWHPSLFTFLILFYHSPLSSLSCPNASWTLIYHHQHPSHVWMQVFWHVGHFYYSCHLLHVYYPLCSPLSYANVSQSHYSHFPSSLFWEVWYVYYGWDSLMVHWLYTMPLSWFHTHPGMCLPPPSLPSNSFSIFFRNFNFLSHIHLAQWSPPSFNGTHPSSNQWFTQAIWSTLTSHTGGQVR